MVDCGLESACRLCSADAHTSPVVHLLTTHESLTLPGIFLEKLLCLMPHHPTRYMSDGYWK